MISNCGLMTERWYNTACEGMEPSIVSGHIPYFHSFLCKWAYNMALPFSWVVVIDAQNKSHLMKSILDVSNIEPTIRGKWELSSKEIETVFSDSVQSTVGCIFATAVEIPGETLSIGQAGGAAKSNGHLGTPIIEGRSAQNSLQIGFRETNLSFVDLFLRPWGIITSYKGLINDSGGISSNSGASYWGGSIKANIHVYQLARAGGSDHCTESVVRKQYHFYDAAPVDIKGDPLVSDGNGGVNVRQVFFSYNYSNITSNLG